MTMHLDHEEATRTARMEMPSSSDAQTSTSGRLCFTANVTQEAQATSRRPMMPSPNPGGRSRQRELAPTRSR